MDRRTGVKLVFFWKAYYDPSLAFTMNEKATALFV